MIMKKLEKVPNNKNYGRKRVEVGFLATFIT